MKISAISTTNYNAQRNATTNNKVAYMDLKSNSNQSFTGLQTSKTPVKRFVLAVLAGLAVLGPVAAQSSDNTDPLKTVQIQLKTSQVQLIKSSIANNNSMIDNYNNNINNIDREITRLTFTRDAEKRNLDDANAQADNTKAALTAQMWRMEARKIQNSINELNAKIRECESQKRDYENQRQGLQQQNNSYESQLDALNGELRLLQQ